MNPKLKISLHFKIHPKPVAWGLKLPKAKAGTLGPAKETPQPHSICTLPESITTANDLQLLILATKPDLECLGLRGLIYQALAMDAGRKCDTKYTKPTMKNPHSLTRQAAEPKSCNALEKATKRNLKHYYPYPPYPKAERLDLLLHLVRVK